MKLKSELIELDKNEDPEPSFSKLIAAVKAFAFVFGFTIECIEPFWGEETEGNWNYCQTGYAFNLIKRFPSSQMYLVSASVFCLTSQHSLKLEKEEFCFVCEEEEDI